MYYEFNCRMLGFKGFSIKKSNAPGQLYHIRYAGHPIFDAFEVSLGYKVKIVCNGHKKTYPRFTFELSFTLAENQDGLLGLISSEKKVDIFDGNHNEFLEDEA